MAGFGSESGQVVNGDADGLLLEMRPGESDCNICPHVLGSFTKRFHKSNGRAMVANYTVRVGIGLLAKQIIESACTRQALTSRQLDLIHDHLKVGLPIYMSPYCAIF